MKLGLIKNNIKFAYLNFPYMCEFVDINAELINCVSDKDLEKMEERNKVQGYAGKFYKSLLNGREVKNGLALEESVLPEKAITFLNDVRVDRENRGVFINPSLQGEYDIVIKNQRIAVMLLDNILLQGNSRFRVVDDMISYGNEKYSIAFKNNKEGFALITEEAMGVKGKHMLKVSYYNEGNYYIDDASKYLSADKLNLFVEGLR